MRCRVAWNATCEELPETDDELREHLIFTAAFEIVDDGDLDVLCDLVDILNEDGYDHWISVNYPDKHKATGTRGKTSDEIRDFFE